MRPLVIDPLYSRIVAIGHERRGECFLLNRKPDKLGYVRLTEMQPDGSMRSRGAHRVVYMQWNQEIPPELHVDHMCHNEAAHKGECAGGNNCWHRRCVNPAHLRAVSLQENIAASPHTARGRGPRGISVRNAQVTTCPQGHVYDGVNTRRKQNKYGVARDCKVCDRQRQMAARHQLWAENGGRPLRTLPSHCRRGHLLDGENLKIRRGRQQICLTCDSVHRAEGYKRRKAKRAAAREARLAIPKEVKLCSECTSRSVSRGMCRIHYRRHMALLRKEQVNG